jgi:aminoglycoside phosphotransferase (APT) family kinase protein
VNRLLLSHPPPVRVPRLLAADRQRRTLVFEAVHGDTLGPKFPLTLDEADVLSGVELVEALGRYRPRRRWFRRLRVARRLALHRAGGLIDRTEAAVIARAAALERHHWRFAHGDITARNLMRERTSGQLVLIDWEWAGLYPRAYDLAFFWFSLVDAAGARAIVESRLPHAERRAFLLSAALVHLLHLHMWRTRRTAAPHWASHEATLRRLLRELAVT